VPVGKKKMGINISTEDGPSFITNVVKNSIADKLGFCKGMQIMKAGGIDCTDSSQNMVLSLLSIRPVMIELLRPGAAGDAPVAGEEQVYASGWFIKKGKSDARDDRRKRFCQLVGPKASIKYYTAVDEQGAGVKQRGSINLEDGFNFWNEESTLRIDTPNRLWTLVVTEDEWQPQMDEWLHHLKEYREGNCLEWERPPEGDALPFTDEVGEPSDHVGMESFPIDTRVPLGTPSPDELKGWFRKKGKSDKISDYTRRFHVLDEAACGIHYYKGVKDGEPVTKKGTVDLSAGYEVVRVVAADKTNSKLQIITPARTWVLIAEDGYRGNKVLEAKIWQRVLMEKRGELVPGMAGVDAVATVPTSLDEVAEEDEGKTEEPHKAEAETVPEPVAVAPKATPPARPPAPVARPSRPSRPGAAAAKVEEVPKVEEAPKVEELPELTAEEEAAERKAAREGAVAAESPEVETSRPEVDTSGPEVDTSGPEVDASGADQAAA
jgi:hypothetical protein